MVELFGYFIILGLLLWIFDWAGNKSLQTWYELRADRKELQELKKEFQEYSRK